MDKLDNIFVYIRVYTFVNSSNVVSLVSCPARAAESGDGTNSGAKIKSSTGANKTGNERIILGFVFEL